jgi:hypothetical protein
LHPLRLGLQIPGFVYVPGRNVCVYERLTLLEMSKASRVIVSSIFYGVVVPDPASNLEEADFTLLAALESIEIGRVQLLSIQKPGLLEDTNPLKPSAR